MRAIKELWKTMLTFDKVTNLAKATQDQPKSSLIFQK